jgi:hypothetical protein
MSRNKLCKQHIRGQNSDLGLRLRNPLEKFFLGEETSVTQVTAGSNAISGSLAYPPLHK